MNSVFYGETGRRRERGWVIDDLTEWEGAKRRVEVVEAGIGQLQSHAINAKKVCNDIPTCTVRPLAVAQPKLVPRPIPDAITCPFENEIGRKLGDMVKSALPLHAVQGVRKHWFFTPALRMAEARKKRFAVQNDCGICRENEVGEIGCWLDEIYLGTG